MTPHFPLHTGRILPSLGCPFIGLQELVRSLHQHCKMVRGNEEEDDGDEGREKLHTPLPGVNCHRSVLSQGYAWASIAAHHSAALFSFISFQSF